MEDLERTWLREQGTLPLPGCVSLGKSPDLPWPRSLICKMGPYTDERDSTIQLKDTALKKYEFPFFL